MVYLGHTERTRRMEASFPGLVMGVCATASHISIPIFIVLCVFVRANSGAIERTLTSYLITAPRTSARLRWPVRPCGGGESGTKAPRPSLYPYFPAARRPSRMDRGRLNRHRGVFLLPSAPLASPAHPICLQNRVCRLAARYLHSARPVPLLVPFFLGSGICRPCLMGSRHRSSS